MLLEEPRVLHLDPKAAMRRLEFHTRKSSSIEHLKACSNSYMLPPTRTINLLTVPLTMVHAFKHISVRRP